MSTKHRLAVFGIGSAGVHAAHNLTETSVGQVLDADSLVQYIDTNPAMLAQLGLPPSSAFITEGTQGGGGIRATAGRALQQQMETAMARLKVGTFNVLIFGAGGATGSTGGPLLASRLLEQGLNVVCVILVSSVAQEAANSLEVLRRLESLASHLGRNVPALLVWRRHGDTDDACQKHLTTAASELSSLFNETHGRLDIEDLKVWLDNYRVPGSETVPSLQALSILTEEEIQDADYADAIIGLHANEKPPQGGGNSGFFKTGQVDEATYNTRYFILREGGLVEAEAVLADAVSEQKNARKSRGPAKRLTSVKTDASGGWEAF